MLPLSQVGAECHCEAACAPEPSQATATLPLLLQLPVPPLRLKGTDVADACLLGGEIPIGLNGSSCFGTVSMQLRPQSVRGRKERGGEGRGGERGGGGWVVSRGSFRKVWGW